MLFSKGATLELFSRAFMHTHRVSKIKNSNYLHKETYGFGHPVHSLFVVDSKDMSS